MRRKQMRRNELPDTCLSTLPSTGQLVVLKHGVRGYALPLRRDAESRRKTVIS